MIREHIPWLGRVRVTTRYRDGRVEVEYLDNVITNAGKQLMAEALAGQATDVQIKQMAWGDDDTEPNAADTELGNETGRKQVTKRTLGDPGELITTVYLAPYDAEGQIEELGWFAGPDATEEPDSGVLVARVLYSKEKTALESITIDREDTIGG